MLQQTLDDEREADDELTQIATIINGVASPDLDDERRPSSLLRYMRATDLDRAAQEYAGHQIRSSCGGALGKVDGFLVEASGRPSYVIIEDIGSLFVGRRRFAVPIDKIELDGSTHTFTIDFDKEKLHRYPPFHRDAFPTMTDEEIQQYARMFRAPNTDTR